jgi:hypothetical protein
MGGGERGERKTKNEKQKTKNKKLKTKKLTNSLDLRKLSLKTQPTASRCLSRKVAFFFCLKRGEREREREGEREMEE